MINNERLSCILQFDTASNVTLHDVAHTIHARFGFEGTMKETNWHLTLLSHKIGDHDMSARNNLARSIAHHLIELPSFSFTVHGFTVYHNTAMRVATLATIDNQSFWDMQRVLYNELGIFPRLKSWKPHITLTHSWIYWEGMRAERKMHLQNVATTLENDRAFTHVINATRATIGIYEIRGTLYEKRTIADIHLAPAETAPSPAA